MHKDSAIRDEVRLHTEKQVSVDIIVLIKQRLAAEDRDKIKRIIEATERLQEQRNKGKRSPVKRLSYKICEEVISNDNY